MLYDSAHTTSLESSLERQRVDGGDCGWETGTTGGLVFNGPIDHVLEMDGGDPRITTTLVTQCHRTVYFPVFGGELLCVVYFSSVFKF